MARPQTTVSIQRQLRLNSTRTTLPSFVAESSLHILTCINRRFVHTHNKKAGRHCAGLLGFMLR
jgi:hypothetical protein